MLAKYYLSSLALLLLTLLTVLAPRQADAAAATHFVVSAPSAATAGTTFSVTVTAQDAGGTTDAGYGGTVHFTSSPSAVPPATAVLPADATLTNGVRTFPVTLKAAGSQTITATDTVAPSITGASGGTTVTAAAATHFSVAPSPALPSGATAGTAFSVAVTALDPYGNPDTTFSGTVVSSSSDKNAGLPTSTTLTSGVGSFSATLKTAGGQTLTATDGTSGLTGTSAAIAVTAAAATHFSVAPSPALPSGATAGTAFSVAITALDQFGNPATGYNGTVLFTSSDPSAVLPSGTPPVFNSSGVATVSVTLKTAGTQTITATDATAAPTIAGQATIAVTAAAVDHLTAAAPPAVNAGVPFSVTVTALDQFGNTATSYGGRVTLTSDDPSVRTLLANQPVTNGTASLSVSLFTSGTRKITATDTGNAVLTATTAPIVIGSNATIHFQVSAPTSVTAGTAFSVAITALDQFGNPATGYNGAVLFTSSDPSVVLPSGTPPVFNSSGVATVSVTLKTAGTQTITATDATAAPTIAGTSGTILVNNVVPTITTASPSPITAGAPDTTLTVTTTAPSYVQGSVVQWNGAPLATTFVDTRRLTAVAPAALLTAAGTANVTVFNPTPGGGVSSPPVLVLIDNPVPDLSAGSLSPGSIVQGSPAFTLGVTGKNFLSTSLVYWNGAARPTSFLDSTHLTAAIPVADVAAVTTAQVTVFTPDPNVPAGHTSPTALPFTVSAFPLPTLSFLTPASATAGDATLTLTINGTGFRSGAAVSFGTITIDPGLVNVVSATQITASIAGSDAKAPASNLVAKSGLFDVQVTNPGGIQSGTLPFKVNAQIVTVAALNPASATVGDPALTLTITGTGFRPDSKVTFGGKSVTSTFVSPTQLTANIYAALFDSLPVLPGDAVQVSNPDGSLSPVATDAAGNLLYTDAPTSTPIPGTHFTVNGQQLTITNLLPPTVPVASAIDPPLILTINGTGFRQINTLNHPNPTNPTVEIANNSQGPFASIPAVDVSFVSPTQLNISIDKTVVVSDLLRLDEVPSHAVPVPVLGLAGLLFVRVTNPDVHPGQVTTNAINSLKVTPLSATPNNSFNPGIQLFSVPYDYAGDLYGVFNNLGAVDNDGKLVRLSDLAAGMTLASWDPSQGYVMTTTAAVPLVAPFGAADELVVGRGYWTHFPVATSVVKGNVTQTNPSYTYGLIRKGVLAQNITPSPLIGQSYPIALKQGWNMIGDPFTKPVLVGNLGLRFSGQTYAFTDATSLGLISGTLYSYGPPPDDLTKSKQYNAQTVTSTLDPFAGYWILALQPCILLVPQP